MSEVYYQSLSRLPALYENIKRMTLNEALLLVKYCTRNTVRAPGPAPHVRKLGQSYG